GPELYSRPCQWILLRYRRLLVQNNGRRPDLDGTAIECRFDLRAIDLDLRVEQIRSFGLAFLVSRLTLNHTRLRTLKFRLFSCVLASFIRRLGFVASAAEGEQRQPNQQYRTKRQSSLHLRGSLYFGAARVCSAFTCSIARLSAASIFASSSRRRWRLTPSSIVASR